MPSRGWIGKAPSALLVANERTLVRRDASVRTASGATVVVRTSRWQIENPRERRPASARPPHAADGKPKEDDDASVALLDRLLEPLGAGLALVADSMEERAADWCAISFAVTKLSNQLLCAANIARTSSKSRKDADAARVPRRGRNGAFGKESASARCPRDRWMIARASPAAKLRGFMSSARCH
jgi:hypothetical protein